MVPTIASSGTSFRGAAAYYLHDKDADTQERVAWTETDNLLTDDPDKAWKVMAWTAMHQSTMKESAGVKATGRKLEKPVIAFSVSWHPEQKPDKAHMLETARAAAAALGLSDHQMMFISHNDEPQPHVHVLVNRVHPDTGRAATLSRSKDKLSAWALEYEKQHGKVYCQARANNADSRKEKRPERDRNPVIQAAWQQSDSGRGFQAALRAEGYILAQGNRRFVVVDRWGKAINPVRQLPQVRAAEFNSRMRDLDITALPSAASAQRTAKALERKKYHAQRKYDEWAAEYLNKNQDRQIEERAKLSERYQRTIETKTAELSAYYNLHQRRHEIEQLTERLHRPSLLRRLTGRAAQDRKVLVALKLTYKDAETRLKEAVGAIETEHTLAVADQLVTHQREKELARHYLEERKLTFDFEERLSSEKIRVGRSGDQRRGHGGRERMDHYCREPDVLLPII